MNNRWREVVRVALIVGLAMAARGAWLARNGPRPGGDTDEYQALARNLITSGSFSFDPEARGPTIRRPPGYPTLLVVLGATDAGRLWRIAVVQIAFDCFSCLLVYQLGRYALSRPAATGAALLYALHPGAIEFCAIALSETVFSMLLLLAAWLSVSAAYSGQNWRVVLAGAAFGAAALVRSFGLVYLFATAVALLLTVPSERRPWRLVGRLLVVAGVTVSPWVVRCYAVSGRLVAIQGASAVNWHVPTMTDVDQRLEDQVWPAFGRTEYGMALHAARTPAEMLAADRIGFREAIANIRRDPAAYLRLRVKSVPFLVLNTFAPFTPNYTGLGATYRAGGWLSLGLVALYIIAFTALPLAHGLASLPTARRNTAAGVCASIWLVTILMHLPMWIEYRFFLPAVPFLFVSAAWVADHWLGTRHAGSDG